MIPGTDHMAQSKMQEGNDAVTTFLMGGDEIRILIFAFMVTALFLMYKGARSHRKKGGSAMKGAGLGLLACVLIYALIFLIVATVK